MELRLPDAHALSELAGLVADGVAVDWDAAESSAPDDSVRELIRRLREVAAVGRAHAVSSLASVPEGAASNQSSLSPFESLPTTWGSLRVLAEIGRGRFGTVYRAWDPALAREVAFKVLRAPDTFATDDAASPRSDAELVVHEGRLMARIRHPNVVTIYGAQRLEGRTGIWMELIEGETLEAALQSGGTFAAADVAKVGVELCRALQAVHQAGLIHRDVKAQNVIRERSGRIVLGDFGTGRDLEDCERTPLIAGTPAYLAPEIFNRSVPTPQSDLYGLGVLLFHLATGGYPVQGRSFRDIRAAHAAGRRHALLTLRPDFPPQLAAVIECSIHPDPRRRVQRCRGDGSRSRRCRPLLKRSWNYFSSATGTQPTFSGEGVAGRYHRPRNGDCCRRVQTERITVRRIERENRWRWKGGCVS